MTETYSIDHTDQLAVSQTPELPLEGFEARHIGLTAGTENSDHQRMLEALGYSSMESFITDVVPDSIYQQGGLNLPDALSEAEALSTLKAIAKKNLPFRSMIGQGYYATETPTVILRNILESPAWYTAYTPYQPEISQGRLEALLNFQTMVCDLTGMDISNASMLDEGSAAAEAMSLAKRSAKNKSNTFFVDQDCLPQTIEVVKTRAHAAGYELYIGDPKTEANSADYFGLLLQYPGCSGEVTNFEQVIENAHAHKSLVIMAADIMSLVILKSPGQLGADVVVGNSQRFGVPVGFGGPHAAFMATKERFQRSLPGRLVGVSIDSDGKPAYRLALQTREQHIRREKATSNICTAQVLLAVIASMYACYHGPAGLRKIACRIHRLTTIAASGINQQGFAVENQYFFDTLTINTGAQTQLIYQRALAAKINLRRISDTQLGFSVDQASTEQEIELIWRLFAPTMQHSFAGIAETAAIDYSAAQYRDDAILTHPVFSKYQSETEMLRYIRRLSDKDLALDRTMIPLGSCTMKLNASSEMIPVTWPEFGSPHPFAPAEQVQGYQQMIAELEQMLAECTGYDVVSLQPNAGSQGEFAGLLAIAAYHKSRGDEQRNICLIPSSAHGTNPASAQMCNMKVVVVNCDSDGNVDLEDLQQKAEQHSKQLAALMVTYPSTHGVFEEQIKTVTALIHQHGGQVYVDGANLNAMVGLCGPGDFGGDVSHLNLHKTFCIPHGGGGPGVGPVAAKAHLAPYLPAIASAKDSSADASRPQVSSAPYGSASILPISWMYMRMMGASGLRRATEAAILSANFIAYRLADAYPVLYTGNKGLVAHECIIDLRGIKESTGIAVEDVSKRLIDYGFHAPTMSFPVAGTLMIEPTESEARCELDRFCDAMLAIKAEIMQVADGQWPLDDNPLVNAPHTAEQLIADQWVHSYSRSEAAYPIASLRKDKYFSPVARIDNVFGDRNLICSCPSMEDFL
ncbi:MAG: glycine dehydrogenase (aminomethyl-transferring) [Actinobacteria bacterium TMED172]|nr:glycine dehydrogenase (aminomethyl-transferring) [Cellvibrionales bacterium]OUW32177.1 MAG: glycine dehydrogenase (aminomethyl-transferring) [Actinobacteria bacterium TMED172]